MNTVGPAREAPAGCRKIRALGRSQAIKDGGGMRMKHENQTLPVMEGGAVYQPGPAIPTSDPALPRPDQCLSVPPPLDCGHNDHRTQPCYDFPAHTSGLRAAQGKARSS